MLRPAHPLGAAFRRTIAATSAGAIVLAWLCAGSAARAEGPSALPPLPPPPGEPAAPAPPEGQPAPEAPTSASPSVEPPPPPPVAPPPPVVAYYAPPLPTHAPRYSLWLGVRLGLLAYSGGLYVNDPATQSIETTGNFVRPGLGFEADVGARLSKRYIPYLALELGLMGAGHRFDSSTTRAGTRFVGIGFRFLAGDVNTASFASDVSIGLRTFEVSNGTGTWSATALEILRLGLGAEIRIDNRFVLSPMLTLSGGSLTDTTGNISFTNQADGQTGPLYTNGQNIPSGTSYVSIAVGCGFHFDLFGE